MPLIRYLSLGVLATLIAQPLTAQETAAPRTGFFAVTLTPGELLGAAEAQAVADILPPDKAISWQLSVPASYTANDAADASHGAVVYVSPTDRGGPPRDWNDMLAAKNLLWIGANDAGNEHPVAERMMKAMLATAVLQKEGYVVAARRSYIAGLSGGGVTATRVMSARPEQFKGGIYMAGTVSWGDRLPPKIDQVRQNRHVFLVGTYDPALQTSQRVYNDFIAAGVSNSKLITIRNYKHRMPPGDYFARAVEYLDNEE